jgi:hypothetical protein
MYDVTRYDTHTFSAKLQMYNDPLIEVACEQSSRCCDDVDEVIGLMIFARAAFRVSKPVKKEERAIALSSCAL